MPDAPPTRDTPPQRQKIAWVKSFVAKTPGLGHAYFIAFYALKNKAKIRELEIPGF